ncbi:protein-(glutamine-N5) methyltransferase, release factor-specific [Idiomarina sp. A28L]|uniref:peptide chain release factor N(5)-glutamine methyltransferase n=1 Tax=Idiomarina sp. A28L TaxID=1036674 RepID=UPI0002138748|nr:peptide chain release factor N(5)-glutamine methyltransferase [Idiomarina sp. A28L]EGN76417.1 protein-(glutamine-N5) methyltransferase, release factor-specific [Idiomarina sp. A28L]
MSESLNIADTLRLAVQRLQKSGSETPDLDAQVLLKAVLHCERSYFYTWPERMLSGDNAKAFEALLQQRELGVPIAHILGNREFWSLDLEVNAATLIPRPDTEILVEAALELVTKPNAKVLELGTGSGAIALALASEKANWQITAVDVVPAAVELAKKNVLRHKLTQVRVVLSSWFSNVSAQEFDLIVSNPPYIDGSDAHLQQGDVRFEPQSALVAAENGLADLRHIITAAVGYLTPGGWLALEHGAEQANAVQSIFAEHHYNEIHTRQDYANLDRVTCGRRG